MASFLRPSVLETSVGGATTLTKQSAAKTWVATDGAASPALATSFNVTSITDNNTGDLTFNITSAMSTATYAVPAGNTLSFVFTTPAAPRTQHAYSRATTTLRCLGGAHGAGGSVPLDFIVYYELLGNLA
jgi:hypothetical protein